jgi:hypothetical protein
MKTETLEKMTTLANREASASTIKTTLCDLANLEASFRSDARVAFAVGLTAKAGRLLRSAGLIREARELISTHATNDENA